MNIKIKIQQLLFTKKRVDMLKYRLEKIMETNSIDEYDGFKPGMFHYHDQYSIFFLDDSDELREFIVEHFEKGSDEYNLEYHLQNVLFVIHQYFYSIINGMNKIKPNATVITEYVDGLEMVSNTINSVIKELEKEIV